MAGTIAQAEPGVWTLKLTDKTFPMTAPYASSRDTVEWITETPLIIGPGGGFAAMPNLSPVRLDVGQVNGANPHLKASEGIQLVTAGKAVATPPGPHPDQDGFNDCI